MERSVFYYVAIGFVAGILLRSFIQISFDVAFFSAVISFSLMVYARQNDLVLANGEIKRYSYFFLVCAFVFSGSIGMLRYQWFVSDTGDKKLSEVVGSSGLFEGVVTEEPTIKDSYVRLTVLIDKVNDKKIDEPTKISVLDDAYSKMTYGDRISISGMLKKPENKIIPGERPFDYVSYLAKDKIFYEIGYAKLDLISSDNGSFLKRILLWIKKKFIDVLDKTISFPESRLAAGLTVAGKQALPQATQDEFTRTGTIQVVVLSGYNVTIVAETAMAFLSFLPNWAGAIVGSAGIVSFGVLSGGSATIVRAEIMALMVLLSKVVKRKYNVDRALLVSALLMLFINPMLLVFDASFQLSFLATIGLMYGTPIVQKYLEKLPEKFNLRQVAAATIATQIFVMPFIIYLTGNLSLVAFPANLALFLLIPLTMFLSFAVGILGFMFVPAATILGYVALVPLKYMLTVVHIFSVIPFASIQIQAMPFYMVILAYVIYAIILMRRRKTLQPVPN